MGCHATLFHYRVAPANVMNLATQGTGRTRVTTCHIPELCWETLTMLQRSGQGTGSWTMSWQCCRHLAALTRRLRSHRASSTRLPRLPRQLAITARHDPEHTWQALESNLFAVFFFRVLLFVSVSCPALSLASPPPPPYSVYTINLSLSKLSL